MKFPLSVRLAGLAAAFGLFAALLPGAASAGSASSSVTVSATVTQNCTISTTTNVAFGAYDPVTVSAVTDATGAVKLTCTKAATGITLTLNGGGHSGSAVAPDTRAMVGATNGDFLSYDIYETGSYATRFPTTPVSETVSGGITTPTTVSLFGQIKAAPQDVSVDTYSDSVQATVNF